MIKIKVKFIVKYLKKVCYKYIYIAEKKVRLQIQLLTGKHIQVEVFAKVQVQELMKQIQVI